MLLAFDAYHVLGIWRCHCGGTPPPVIKFDHPFVFMVNDGLFVGVINNPNLKN